MNKLDVNIPIYVKEIITQLQNAGFEAYIVGGCVRDALLEKKPNDWDVCTSAHPEVVKDVLQGFKIYDTGIMHGTVTAVKNGNICEITTFRSDGDYSDHRHPDFISFTHDIRSDLARRDFTVNAMAYSPSTGLIDIFGGQEDLCFGTLRCVGNPETRFTEDALRIIRALRFSSCLGFKIEQKTKESIFICYKLIDYVAKERIFNELKRLICGKNASEIICEFSTVFERIFKLKIIPKNVRLIDLAPKDVYIRLALLFFKIDTSVVRSALKNLKSDNKIINNVIFLLENSEWDLKKDRIIIRKLLSEFGRERSRILAEFIFIVKEYAEHQRELIRELIASTPVITFSELAINGSDILKLGVSPGKEVKNILKKALNAVVSETCENTKDSLITFISN